MRNTMGYISHNWIVLISWFVHLVVYNQMRDMVKEYQVHNMLFKIIQLICTDINIIVHAVQHAVHRYKLSQLELFVMDNFGRFYSFIFFKKGWVYGTQTNKLRENKWQRNIAILIWLIIKSMQLFKNSIIESKIYLIFSPIGLP